MFPWFAEETWVFAVLRLGALALDLRATSSRPLMSPNVGSVNLHTVVDKRVCQQQRLCTSCCKGTCMVAFTFPARLGICKECNLQQVWGCWLRRLFCTGATNLSRDMPLSREP